MTIDQGLPAVLMNPMAGASAKSATEDLRAERELASWYRWGWAPLVGGCFLLAILSLASWEVLLVAAGIEPDQRGHQWWFLGRAVAMSGLMAAWTGWYVLAARRRLDAAAERLRAREAAVVQEARKVERQVGLAALSRGLAHELRTPLNGLVVDCALLKRLAGKPAADPSAEMHRVLAMMEAEIERLSNLVVDYVECGKAAEISPVWENRDLLDLAEEAFGPWRATFAERCITIEILSRGLSAPVSVDRARMKQAFDQIIRNAVEVMPAGGVIEVACVRENGRSTITISDDGPGFEAPEAVFRPFFTTKSSGSGLGLAIVRDVVRAHGGEVFASNRAGRKGGSITIRLPVRGS